MGHSDDLELLLECHRKDLAELDELLAPVVDQQRQLVELLLECHRKDLAELDELLAPAQSGD